MKQEVDIMEIQLTEEETQWLFWTLDSVNLNQRNEKGEVVWHPDYVRWVNKLRKKVKPAD